jgi:serine/threonine-protein phosphatase PP1 catalytic subunit
MADGPDVELDGLISRLWSIKNFSVGTSAHVTQAEVYYLYRHVVPIFQSQPVLLELSPPITIVGDTHGQFHDLVRIFDDGITPENTQFLFLGDYIDRGRNSVENLCLLLAYKIKYPTNLWMLRGNHECSYINRLYGFYDDCARYWTGPGVGQVLWKIFGEIFNWLPIAAIIERKIFCVHGGLSPHLNSLDDIRNIQRPTELPDDGLLCDLVWSDPNPDVNGWVGNERGTSVCFGEQQVADFLHRFDFDLVCRAHQAVMGGWEFPFAGVQTIITLFSAPNYCYEFMNKGAILNVDDKLFCSFRVLEPIEVSAIGQPEIIERPGTPPRGGPAQADAPESFFVADKIQEKVEEHQESSSDEEDVIMNLNFAGLDDAQETGDSSSSGEEERQEDTATGVGLTLLIEDHTLDEAADAEMATELPQEKAGPDGKDVVADETLAGLVGEDVTAVEEAPVVASVKETAPVEQAPVVAPVEQAPVVASVKETALVEEAPVTASVGDEVPPAEEAAPGDAPKVPE